VGQKTLTGAACLKAELQAWKKAAHFLKGGEALRISAPSAVKKVEMQRNP
jgi:hypothetical protein